MLRHRYWVVPVAVLVMAWSTGPASAQTRTGGISGGGITGSSTSGGGFSGSTGSSRGSSVLGTTGTGSFSGSSSSASFMGSTGNFMGTSGSMTGMTGSNLGTNRNSANPFAATQANPFQLGQFGGTTTTGFNAAGGNVTGTNQFRAGSGNNFGAQNNFNNGMVGRNNMMGGSMTGTTGATQSPAFTIRGLTDSRSASNSAGNNVRNASATISRFQSIVANSSRLSQSGTIACELVDGLYVLKGNVATVDDKQLAEMLLRLEPGVYTVRNELQVARREEPFVNPSQ